MRRFVFVLAPLIALSACRGEAVEEESEPTAADSVAQALAEFDPAILDTATWESRAAALARGANVWKWACATCHGEEGRGDGEYEIEGDTLHPPSFQTDDWRFADDPEGLRRYIYAGNVQGMPHWGLRQMRARDIVALDLYIRTELIQGD